LSWMLTVSLSNSNRPSRSRTTGSSASLTSLRLMEIRCQSWQSS
jgi:hypothetical protein